MKRSLFVSSIFLFHFIAYSHRPYKLLIIFKSPEFLFFYKNFPRNRFSLKLLLSGGKMGVSRAFPDFFFQRFFYMSLRRFFFQGFVHLE